MIETAQWLIKLTEASSLDYDTVKTVWEKLIELTVQRLSSEYTVSGTTLPGIVELSTLKEGEFVAHLSNGESWIIPPHIRLVVSPVTIQGTDLINQLLIETLSYTKETILKVSNAIKDSFKECMCAGYCLQWQHIGTFSATSDGGKIFLTPSQELLNNINKPFSALSSTKLNNENILSGIREQSFPSLMEALRYEPLYIPLVLRRTTPPELPQKAILPPPIKKISQTTPPPPIRDTKEKKQKRNGAGLKVWLLVILILSLGYFIISIVPHLRQSQGCTSLSREDTVTSVPQTTITEEKEPTCAPYSEFSVPEDKKDSTDRQPAVAVQQVDTKPKVNRSQKLDLRVESGYTPYVVRSGDTLASIATKTYGNRVFWVYIYNANKDVLLSFDHLEPNTKIYLPPLESWGISANNTESIQAAEELQSKLKHPDADKL